MSVVGIKIGVEEKQTVWHCWSCVRQLAISVNIGQPEVGKCDRCGFHTMRYKRIEIEVN